MFTLDVSRKKRKLEKRDELIVIEANSDGAAYIVADCETDEYWMYILRTTTLYPMRPI